MKKATTLDKEEMELARSLENEEWVSDLSKKEKKQYEEYARYSLNKPCCCIKFGAWIYPVRNNAPLGFESQRLEFLTGFTQPLPREGWLSNQYRHLDQSKGDLWKLSSKG
jgi:hypothetical protein